MVASAGPDSNIGPKKNKYSGTRKFAYSLTDKYKANFEELVVLKQPGVYSGSHISSSDGGASYMVASENEHITETSSRRKDKSAGHMKGANPGARLGNMASSQGNLPLNQQ